MNETTAYLPGLSPVETKEIRARFNGGQQLVLFNAPRTEQDRERRGLCRPSAGEPDPRIDGSNKLVG